MMLPFKESLVMYASYHRHPANQLIHFVFVPVIFWSALVLLGYLPLPRALAEDLSLSACAPALRQKLKRAQGAPECFCVVFTWCMNMCMGTAVLAAALKADANWPFATVVVALYTALYVSWDWRAGLSWAAVIGAPCAVAASLFQSQVQHAWRYAIAANALSWYMQIHPGHAIFEKRKPALTDSIVQAFATAPLFVWLEALFACGYRPQLRQEVAHRAEAHLPASKSQ